ncbi:MAG: septal ring lytic transglycosylase RlpA family protein [Thermodesulfovibrionales bacterium]
MFKIKNSGIIHLEFLILNFALCFIASCATARYETHPELQYAIASWYGPEFHGRPTASGERFDMHALTCAHREYPFGTILKVTSISSGRSVRCIVNDRGPFVSGRDIDLSYAAAKEIGLIGPGTVSVRIEYLGRDVSYIKEVRYISSKGPYTIQIGSFREIDNARHLKSSLELKYRGVYVIETVINGATYYRVRIGKFLNMEDARQLASTVAEEGYSPLVMHYDEQA